MGNALHSNQTHIQGIHQMHSFEYADATARSSAVLAATDIGKVSRQLDNNTFWILTNNSPMSWVQIGAEIAIVNTIVEEVSGISALKVAAPGTASNSHVVLANNTDDLKSEVLGVAINGGVLNDTIQIQTLGILSDTSFSGFSLNQRLFVDANGNIVAGIPSTNSGDNIVEIGYAIGNNSIYINIEPRVKIE